VCPLCNLLFDSADDQVLTSPKGGTVGGTDVIRLTPPGLGIDDERPRDSLVPNLCQVVTFRVSQEVMIDKRWKEES
jgi:hypothetical protein